MKTKLFRSTVLVASLLSVLGSASAETLRARIPFGFSADGTTMPPGAYTIRTMSGTPTVLLFENEESKVQTIVFARFASLPAETSAEPLKFTAGSSDTKELTDIATAGRTYELSTHPTRKLKGVVLTLGGK